MYISQMCNNCVVLVVSTGWGQILLVYHAVSPAFSFVFVDYKIPGSRNRKQAAWDNENRRYYNDRVICELGPVYLVDVG